MALRISVLRCRYELREQRLGKSPAPFVEPGDLDGTGRALDQEPDAAGIQVDRRERRGIAS
jgi:hypothetical protein